MFVVTKRTRNGMWAAVRSATLSTSTKLAIITQLAMVAAGLTDGYVASTRRVVFEFAGSLSGPLWSASCEDADRFLAEQRRAGRPGSTRSTKAVMLAQFYAFVIARYRATSTR